MNPRRVASHPFRERSGRPATVERIDAAADFEALRDEWNELLASSGSDCLFLTWEWLHTWWKHFSNGRNLFILTVRRGRELVAIAPLTLRPRRFFSSYPVLEFLGAGLIGSDYLDVILRRGQEDVALEALAGYLVDRRSSLDLARVERNSALALELARRIERCGWVLSEAVATPCPFIPLAGHSWQSYLATLGPSQRYNFRRRLKKLTQKFDVRFGQAVSEEQRPKVLAMLVALHNERWQERGGMGAFHTRALLAFHEELSRLALGRGWLRLFVLWLDEKPAASLYGFRYGRTFYFYQSGFDPSYSQHSVGLVTMGLTIKSAIEEKAEEYDLLHGGERYKFLWTREARWLARLELYPPGPRGSLQRTAVGFSRGARRLARRVLPDAVADKISAAIALMFGMEK